MNENDRIVEIEKSRGGTQYQNSADVCEAIPDMPVNPQFAYAYIRFQNTQDLFPLQEALENGTVFKQLNMPYCGWDSRIVN